MTRRMTALVGARTKVIPDGWEAHHIPTAAGQFTAEGELFSGGTGRWVWDEDLQRERPDYGTVIYRGPLRYQHLNQPKDRTAGDQPVTIHDYRVSIPEDVNDVSSVGWVRILVSTDESAHMLKVTGIERGSLRWQRDLYCTDNIL